MLMYQSLLGAISVVLLGGLDSIAGAIVGGMILGLIQSLVVGYLSPSLADVILISFSWDLDHQAVRSIRFGEDRKVVEKNGSTGRYFRHPL